VIALEVTIDTRALSAAIDRVTGPEFRRSFLRALEKRSSEARTAGVREFTQHGIGRRIFGWANEGAYKIITLLPTRVDGDSIVATLRAVGLAALQETGGRIRPHLIKPKRASILAFETRGAAGFGGDLAFARLVHHPGGALPKHPALLPAAEKVPAIALEDIRRDLAALWAGRAA
jgi:hypothetical protein